ncbi:MAG: ComF family protein [Candidatus Omnitrophica bacterium]|nr:ComF family protein [Candidatus Omnitrophota bacterium]
MFVSLYKKLRDLFFPRFCFNCETHIYDGLLCEDCLKRLKVLAPGKGRAGLCKKCRQKKPDYDSLISCFLYREPLKQLLFLYKYGHYDFFSSFFSSLIADHLKRIGFPHHDYDLIIPVPLYRTKRRQRQYNQTELLARGLSGILGIPCAADILYCRRPHRSQTAIDKTRRKDNVKDVFAVKRPLRRENIIILDDVVTTCATIAECSKVLKEDNCGKIAVITLARAQ